MGTIHIPDDLLANLKHIAVDKRLSLKKLAIGALQRVVLQYESQRKPEKRETEKHWSRDEYSQ